MKWLRAACLCATLLLPAANCFAPPRNVESPPSRFPFAETLTYRVEWRLVTAGNVKLKLSQAQSGGWQFAMDIGSAGVVTRLYRVLDDYRVSTNPRFCAVNSNFDAQEGKRHKLERMSFDPSRRKVDYEERDLLKNTDEKKTLDVPPCTYEIAGALAALRAMDLPPGKSIQLPITDGKKLAYGRIEAQARESLNLDGKTYQAIRYEAFLFDNVLFRRKGRLLIWVTDDAARTPVQLRLQLGFPIGGVTVELEKQTQW